MKSEAESYIKQVVVIGLGRIGLPQALTLAQSGTIVFGFDRNAQSIEQLKQGVTPFYEPSMSECLKETQGTTFFPLSSWEDLNSILPKIDAILFTVGTQPPTEQELTDKVPFDLTEYFAILDHLFANRSTCKKGVKLIIRTTLPLGSTDLLKNYLERTHSIKEGKDFYLAFVPERITEGQVMEELKTLPKIIGVYTDAAFEPISKLFQNGGGDVLRVRNPITAEFCKLTDNSFRSTMFGYANEIAMHASDLDVDAEEVINVVNNNYQRNSIPQPGFVSGYCLTKDPYIFELKFLKNKKQRVFHSVWYYARKTNDYLIDFVVQKTLTHLKNKHKNSVALLGLSFKEDIDDFRMSHSFKIMEKLIAAKVSNLKVYDPFLNQNKYTTIPEKFLPYITLASNRLDQGILADVDAIILCVRHKTVLDVNSSSKLAEILAHTHKPCYLFDGWDCWEAAINIKHINYEGIGFKNH